MFTGEYIYIYIPDATLRVIPRIPMPVIDGVYRILTMRTWDYLYRGGSILSSIYIHKGFSLKYIGQYTNIITDNQRMKWVVSLSDHQPTA